MKRHNLRLIARVLAVIAVALISPRRLLADKPESICRPQVPCSDPRGCPDMSIDPGIMQSVMIDIHTFLPTDCAVVEGMATAGTRKLLLFTTQTNNRGPGALVLGNPADHPDWFEYSACHGHYHIKDWAEFRLWTEAGFAQWKALRAANPTLCAQQIFDANPDLASLVVRGNKLGLCFEDSLLMAQAPLDTEICPRTPDPRTYVSCDYAGLSVCWADQYSPIYGFIDGQWIDVTDVPTGYYVLENEANDSRLITETDYTNDSSAALIRILNRNVKYIQPM